MFKTIHDSNSRATPPQRLLITQANTCLRRYMRIKNSRSASLRAAERVIYDCVREKGALGLTDGETMRDLFTEIERLIENERGFNNEK